MAAPDDGRGARALAQPQVMFLSCSHAPTSDPRTLRLYDMKPCDVLTVQRSCGQISRFAAGELQRKSQRVFFDMLICDLQYRLRCRHCRRTKGMHIILWDGEPSGTRDPHDAGAHIVIVEGDVNKSEGGFRRGDRIVAPAIPERRTQDARDSTVRGKWGAFGVATFAPIQNRFIDPNVPDLPGPKVADFLGFLSISPVMLQRKHHSGVFAYRSPTAKHICLAHIYFNCRVSRWRAIRLSAVA